MPPPRALTPDEYEQLSDAQKLEFQSACIADAMAKIEKAIVAWVPTTGSGAMVTINALMGLAVWYYHDRRLADGKPAKLEEMLICLTGLFEARERHIKQEREEQQRGVAPPPPLMMPMPKERQ